MFKAPSFVHFHYTYQVVISRGDARTTILATQILIATEKCFVNFVSGRLLILLGLLFALVLQLVYDFL